MIDTQQSTPVSVTVTLPEGIRHYQTSVFAERAVYEALGEADGWVEHVWSTEEGAEPDPDRRSKDRVLPNGLRVTVMLDPLEDRS